FDELTLTWGDTTEPTAVTVSALSAYSNSTTISVSWTGGSDDNLAHFNLKLCSAADCSTGCGGITTAANSPASLAASGDGSFYACVQAEDEAGNISEYDASPAAIIVDTTDPSVDAGSDVSTNAA